MAPASAQSNGFAALHALYDATLKRLVVPFNSQFVPTRFGKTHLITAVLDSPVSIILLHGAASNAAACWPLINGLAKTCAVYAIDIPRHLGKTEPSRLSPRRDD